MHKCKETPAVIEAPDTRTVQEKARGLINDLIALTSKDHSTLTDSEALHRIVARLPRELILAAQTTVADMILSIEDTYNIHSPLHSDSHAWAFRQILIYRRIQPLLYYLPQE